jgi:hypothetical protein
MFFACDKDSEDVSKPVINLIEPEDGDSLKIGAAVHFEMELSDDTELSSYKVDIHTNFDGHTHTKTVTETVDFTFSKSWDVSGKKNALVHHHEIVIPENATEGNYHLMVYCTDKAGNESYFAHNIVLSHDAAEHVE